MKRIVFIFTLLAFIASISSCLPLYNNNGGDTSGVTTVTTSGTAASTAFVPSTAAPTTVPPLQDPSKTTANTATTATSSTVVNPYADYLDEAQTHKPTYEEFLSITHDMPMTEVVERLGKPHSFGGATGNLWYWYIADGRLCYVSIIIPSDVPDVPNHMVRPEQLLKYGVVRGTKVYDKTSE